MLCRRWQVTCCVTSVNAVVRLTHLQPSCTASTAVRASVSLVRPVTARGRPVRVMSWSNYGRDGPVDLRSCCPSYQQPPVIDTHMSHATCTVSTARWWHVDDVWRTNTNHTRPVDYIQIIPPLPKSTVVQTWLNHRFLGMVQRYA